MLVVRWYFFFYYYKSDKCLRKEFAVINTFHVTDAIVDNSVGPSYERRSSLVFNQIIFMVYANLESIPCKDNFENVLKSQK